MPTYGYRCTSCSHQFERFQKISDPAITECETCGQPVKKILYPVGIQFKGSGFYVNDYAPKSAPSESAGASSTPGSSESAPASTTATESKTAPAASAPATPSSTPSSSSS